MITRRNTLIYGAAALVGCAPFSGEKQVWHTDAVGTPGGVSGSITLYGISAARADVLFANVQEMIARFSQIFSLDQPKSQISQLNQMGMLAHSAPELIELIGLAHKLSMLSNGVFDISVQALWQAMKDGEMTPGQWKEKQALVNFRNIKISGQSVAFAKEGMAITLNGIAQGYITQKISTFLANAHVPTGLVNLGEFQAFGAKKYTIGIQNPHQVLQNIANIHLQNAGLATSAAAGGYMGAGQSHILAPYDGRVPPAFASASVVHGSAAMADGLATAFTMMDESTIRTCAGQAAVQHVVLVRHDGRVLRW